MIFRFLYDILNTDVNLRRKENLKLTGFAEFFTSVKEARFGFDVIWDFIVSLYYSITENPDISVIWDGIMAAIEPARTIVMTVLVIFSVLIAMFGKKMIGTLKFIFFFVVGFTLGTHLLAPLLPPEVTIPAWIIGLVIGIVAGVLYRILYVLLYSTVFGYGAYIIFYNGFFFSKEPAYSLGKALTCLIGAALVLVIALIFRRFVEMVGTAALGGWLAAWIFAGQIYDFTSWGLFGGVRWIALFIPALIIGALGAWIQIKTRRRY